VSISGDDPLTRMGKIDFSGVQKQASLAYVPEVQVGDYVILHVGYAIGKLDTDEALRTLELFGELSASQDADAVPT